MTVAMHTIVRSLLVGVTLLVVAACSGESPPAGAGATAGAAGSGAPSAGAAGGGSLTAGSGGAGGSAAGASSVGGAAGSNAGAGGTAGGTAGGGGSAGSGGDAGHVAKPSMGCGNMNPATGSRTIMTGGQMGMFNVKLPTGYDPMKPVPLGFGFHGANNGACGPDTGECRGFAMLPAVTVYMKSLGSNWEDGSVLEKNITFWQDVLALMKKEYCIDESRIFVAGVSSGGQFIEYLSCRFGDTLWQTTAVSASVVNAANMNCKGTPPVLVIHGVTDQAGNYGQGVAELFAKRNGCSATAPAGLAQAKTDMKAAFDAQKAEHVCLDWDACTANPVRFCISSQITYSGLTHGWPMVGGMLISDFQGTIK
jgi:polyhydroxybutyrate depolymerase